MLVTEDNALLWLVIHLIYTYAFAVQGPTTALSEPYLNDITMFDVNTHTWHTPDVKGARPPVRDSHAAVALGDRMVIYGGDCGKEYLGDVWAYHVGHQKWQAFKVRALHLRQQHTPYAHSLHLMLVRVQQPQQEKNCFDNSVIKQIFSALHTLPLVEASHRLLLLVIPSCVM